MTPRPILYVMLKQPVPGRVKTRLARDIGVIDATWWFRHQSAALLRRLGRDPRWRLVIAASPAPAVAYRGWPAHLPRVAQCEGDLGRRMMALLRRPHPVPALIVGGDIPAIAPQHIRNALRALGSAPVVFGPATDGGYWLLGVRHPGPHLPAHLLDGVRWSTASALDDSRRALAGLGPARLIDQLSDVDCAADL